MNMGKSVIDFNFCGKPNPLMMRTGLNMLGCHSAEAVMVGDHMDTDVISGMESGIKWSGRYRQYSKSKREIVFDNWKML